jgi:hypothetical protein
VLMDPSFDLGQVIGPTIRRCPASRASQDCRWPLSNIRDSPKQLPIYLRETVSPANANSILFRRRKEAGFTGLPILIFRALGQKSKIREFDYFNYVVELASCNSQVVINGAHYSFASRRGRAAVRQHTEQWLNTCFPLTSLKH